MKNEKVPNYISLALTTTINSQDNLLKTFSDPTKCTKFFGDISQMLSNHFEDFHGISSIPLKAVFSTVPLIFGETIPYIFKLTSSISRLCCGSSKKVDQGEVILPPVTPPTQSKELPNIFGNNPSNGLILNNALALKRPL